MKKLLAVFFLTQFLILLGGSTLLAANGQDEKWGDKTHTSAHGLQILKQQQPQSGSAGCILEAPDGTEEETTSHKQQAKIRLLSYTLFLLIPDFVINRSSRPVTFSHLGTAAAAERRHVVLGVFRI